MWALSKNSKQKALEHSQMQSLILQRTAELQNLSQRLLKVQDEERRKLSRDLHDSTGQTLTALKISISFLQQQWEEEPSKKARFSEVAQLADQAIEEIRTMSYLLHPPLLDEVGFACAAEWYIGGLCQAKRGDRKFRHCDGSGTVANEHGDCSFPYLARKPDECASALWSEAGFGLSSVPSRTGNSRGTR